MANIFQLNKKYGEWAENTVFYYFKRNKTKIGLDAFYYGSQVATRKKDTTDAPLRPDFIILKTKNVKVLEKRYHLDFNKVSLKKLKKLFELNEETLNFIRENPQYWLTKISDKTKFMKDLVAKAHCRLEIKSGFGFFIQKEYERGKYNIIVDYGFKKRMHTLNRRFRRKLKTYVAYVQLNKIFIAELNEIFSKKGETIERPYERRGTAGVKRVKTQNLNFLNSHEFADVEGVVKEKNGKYSVKAKPYIEIIKGSVRFNLDIPIGTLKNVNIDIIQELK